MTTITTSKTLLLVHVFYRFFLSGRKSFFSLFGRKWVRNSQSERKRGRERERMREALKYWLVEVKRKVRTIWEEKRRDNYGCIHSNHSTLITLTFKTQRKRLSFRERERGRRNGEGVRQTCTTNFFCREKCSHSSLDANSLEAAKGRKKRFGRKVLRVMGRFQSLKNSKRGKNKKKVYPYSLLEWSKVSLSLSSWSIFQTFLLVTFNSVTPIKWIFINTLWFRTPKSVKMVFLKLCDHVTTTYTVSSIIVSHDIDSMKTEWKSETVQSRDNPSVTRFLTLKLDFSESERSSGEWESETRLHFLLFSHCYFLLLYLRKSWVAMKVLHSTFQTRS